VLTLGTVTVNMTVLTLGTVTVNMTVLTLGTVTVNMRVLTLGTVTDQNLCLAVQNNKTLVSICAGHSSFLLLQLQSHEKPMFSNFHK